MLPSFSLSHPSPPIHHCPMNSFHVFLRNITLFNHVCQFHDPRICQWYFVGFLNKVRVIIYYSYSWVDTWKFGWSYNLGTIHKNQYSSRHYSHETLFIPILFVENTLHSNIISEILTLFAIFILFILALCIICIGVNFFLYSKFLTMKVR